MVLRGNIRHIITNIIPFLKLDQKFETGRFFEFLSLDGAPIPADASMLKFERVVEGNNRALIVKNVTKELGFNLVRLKAAKFISYRDYEVWAKLCIERRVKGFSRLLTGS